MSTQTQTLMEKLVTEIDTKNSWGKNQLVETTIKIYRGINVSDNELVVFSNFIALRSWLEKGQYAEEAKDTDIFVAKILDMLQIEVAGDDQVKIEKQKVEQKKRGRKKKNEENK